MAIKKRNLWISILYCSDGFIKRYHTQGDDLKDREEISQLASKLKREIDLLATEYDNALEIMQKIGLQAKRQESSGNVSAEPDGRAPAESDREDLAGPSRTPAENDDHELEQAHIPSPGASAGLQGRQPGVMHQPPPDVDNEVITHSQNRFGKSKGRQPDNGMGRIAAPQQAGTDEMYRVAAESAEAGRYAMDIKSKKSSVRTIETEKVRPRIAPIVRDGPKKVMEHGQEIELDEPDEQESELTLEQQLVKCRACGTEVSARSVVCVSCGEFIKD